MLELFSLKKKNNFIELVACTIKKEKKRKWDQQLEQKTGRCPN